MPQSSTTQTSNKPPMSNTRFGQYQHRARIGDLISRTVLSSDQKFAVLLAGLAALSMDRAELEKEMTDILQDGCSVDLAEDILIQMAAYLGFPKADHALSVLAGLLAKNGDAPKTAPTVVHITADERYQRGITDYARLNPDALNTINSAFGDIAGDVIKLTFQAFGDVYASSNQTLITRQLATISALAILGGTAPQLKFHIGASLHVGVSQAQIVEVVSWVQYLAGMPAAYNMLVEVKASLAEGPGAAPGYQ